MKLGKYQGVLGPLLALALASGCNKTVDAESFEKTMRDKLTAMGVTVESATCAKGVAAKVGAKFSCKAGIGGKSYEIDLVVVSVDGSKVNTETKWRDGEAIVAGKLVPALKKALDESLSTDTKIDCGKDALLFIDKERQVRCVATAGDAPSEIAVTFDDKLVATEWKLNPPLLAKAKIEKAMATELSAKLGNNTVTCPGTEFVPRPGDGILRCEVQKEGVTGKGILTVEVKEDLSIGKWDVKSE